MSPTTRRIGVLAGVLGAGILAVLLHLFFLMVEQHDRWLLHSFGNRWGFRDVPTQRGAILDRHGRVLVHDVPSFDLSLIYAVFRRLHPVGAAVHGATLRMEQVPGMTAVRFGYVEGPCGPEQALYTLLSTPLHWFERGVLPQEAARDLRFYLVSALSALTGRPSHTFHTALREAVAKGAPTGVSVMAAFPGIDAATMLHEFRQVVDRLDRLDRDLQQLGATVSLRERLDEMRSRWFEGQVVRDHEYWLRPLADRLDFTTAAALGADAEASPGFVLEPAVVRERLVGRDGDSTLALLLGSVRDLDRLDTDSEVFENRLRRALGEDDLDTLVPEDAFPDRDARTFLRQRAEAAMRSVLRRRERQGSTGIERTQDERLSGLPGFRLVGRDKSARERLLLSSLRVFPGRDLQITVDLDLQELVERQAAQALDDLRRHPLSKASLLDVGVALVDASTGDVLALGGAPLRVPGANGEEVLRGQPPGLSWRGAGDLGSVVKPFVLLEQLAAERAGRPHRPLQEFTECGGTFGRDRGQRLGCSHPHFSGGRDPQAAIAQSCNVFFYQAATGLQREGVLRAMARFGLASPDLLETEPRLAGSWQLRPVELPWPMAPFPRYDPSHGLLRSAIGYGVQASVLHVARAYAGLCTGVLPDTGFLLGEARPRHDLGIDARDLLLVQAGLRDCVQIGTARHTQALRALGVFGKTGTAEVGRGGENNAWFAGFLPYRGPGGVQLAFCAAVYFVPDGATGGEVTGRLMGSILEEIDRDPTLHARYLQKEEGR